jgi:hypothetical protein
MVIEAFSQLGLPAPYLAPSSVEPWLVALTCAIIWLALSGGRTASRSERASRA